MIFDKIIDRLNEYVKIKVENIKLEVTAQVAKVLSHVIVFLLITLVAFFFGFFLMIMLAEILNNVFDSNFLGYLSVTVILFVLLILLGIMLKTGKIQKWLETLILKLSEDE